MSLIFHDQAVHQIKASASNDHFDNQVILIYTKDNWQDRARIFRLLQEQGLIISPASPIKYKTQNDTLYDTQNAQNGERMSDQVSFITEQVPLMEILYKLKEHSYVLHGGGKIVGGKKYAQSAGELVEQIEAFLSKKIDFAIPEQIEAAQFECKQLLSSIKAELATKTTATKGSWFFGLGGRDQSTADLYAGIISLVDQENDELQSSSEETKLLSSSTNLG